MAVYNSVNYTYCRLHLVWNKLLLYITRMHVGSEGVVPFILNICAEWSEWLALHLGHFTPQENRSWHPLNRRPAGPQSGSGLTEEDIIFLPLPGIAPPFLGRPACTHTDYAIPAYRISFVPKIICNGSEWLHSSFWTLLATELCPPVSACLSPLSVVAITDTLSA